jgi:ABC-type thiamin/hydroxymethylpyrimidine transport system permease subunit
MAGVIAIVVTLVVVIPVVVLMSGAVASAVLGWALNDDVDHNYAGSELLETNY